MSKSIQDRLKRLETLYKCLCANPSGEGPAGPAGPPGQGFTYQGNWDSGTTYQPYDVVTYLGSTYITPTTNTGSTPSYDNSNGDWYLFTSVGEQGPPGNGGEVCPDHIKLAAVSGRFTTTNFNVPDLTQMFSGSGEFGWSFGNYNLTPAVDSFGNLLYFKWNQAHIGIPLPVDLNVGDTVKISGIALITDVIEGDLVEPKFYITVSSFNCSDVDRNVFLSTVIPVSKYDIDKERRTVCFSETVILSSILPADETFFVVGIGAGVKKDLMPTTMILNFSYALDATQACIGTGENLFIRNCCDPAYSEVILNNGTPVGDSFVDSEGNCWSVESKTLDAVNSIRTLGTSYADCTLCMASNPCPENFVIQSCCGDIPQIFSAALIGVNVGDTFVDTNGFCWSAIDITGGPITNVVDVDTVYPGTTCESAECTDANNCPTVVNIRSCCDALGGTTTLELLQAAIPTLVPGSAFVDTFGMCWTIRDSGYAFPDLSFIVPATEYPFLGMNIPCEDCLADNSCPKEFYYTIQNCCTEEVEVAVLEAFYNVGEVLTLDFTTGYGCYEILSWSDTGVATITVNAVVSISADCRECTGKLYETLSQYCPGEVMCCTTYRNISEKVGDTGIITGYKCDGTWIVDFVLNPGDSICMAQVLKQDNNITKVEDCCEFDILNPSLTQSMTVVYETCGGLSGEKTLDPNTLLSVAIGSCVTCVRRVDGTDNDFVYVPCT